MALWLIFSIWIFQQRGWMVWSSQSEAIHTAKVNVVQRKGLVYVFLWKITHFEFFFQSKTSLFLKKECTRMHSRWVLRINKTRIYVLSTEICKIWLAKITQGGINTNERNQINKTKPRKNPTISTNLISKHPVNILVQQKNASNNAWIPSTPIFLAGKPTDRSRERAIFPA